MKKNITIMFVTIMIIILGTFGINKVYAVTTAANVNNTTTQNKSTEKVLTNETESTLVELKEKEMKSLEDYKETYGSDAYGLTAYILHKLQIYSIPFCFLGIMVGGIYNYVLGIRHLEIQEKGLALMVSFVTLAIICQVLPLVFTIVVKFGRE
ncbi:MAG: hypothetical protein V8R39_06935 [Clostridia bacterium]|jgi:hypothetical protein